MIYWKRWASPLARPAPSAPSSRSVSCIVGWLSQDTKNQAWMRRTNSGMATEFFKVAELDDVEEGDLIPFEVDGEPICLTRIEGVIYAFQDNCTHISGTLNEDELEGRVLTCP